MLLLDTFPTYTVKRIIIIIAFVGFVCERLEQLQLQIICQPQGQLFFFFLPLVKRQRVLVSVQTVLENW